MTSSARNQAALPASDALPIDPVAPPASARSHGAPARTPRAEAPFHVPLALSAPPDSTLLAVDGLRADAALTLGEPLTDGLWLLPVAWAAGAMLRLPVDPDGPHALTVTALPGVDDAPLAFTLQMPGPGDAMPLAAAPVPDAEPPTQLIGARARLAAPAADTDRLELMGLAVQADSKGLHFVLAGGYVLEVEAGGYQPEVRGLVFHGAAPLDTYAELLRKVGLVTSDRGRAHGVLFEVQGGDGRWHRIAEARTDQLSAAPAPGDAMAPAPWEAPVDPAATRIAPPPQPVRLTGALPDGAEQVLIGGVPEDARLSAGRPRGDGEWILAPQELTNLSLDAPAHGGEALRLAVEVVTARLEPFRPVPLRDGGAPWPDLVADAVGAGGALLVDGVPDAATLSSGARDPESGGWRVSAATALASLALTPLDDLEPVRLVLRLQPPETLPALGRAEALHTEAAALRERAAARTVEAAELDRDGDEIRAQARALKAEADEAAGELGRQERAANRIAERAERAADEAEAARTAAAEAARRASEDRERAEALVARAEARAEEAARRTLECGLDRPLVEAAVEAVRGVGRDSCDRSEALRRRAFRLGMAGGLGRAKARALAADAAGRQARLVAAHERIEARNRQAAHMAERAEELAEQAPRLRERAAVLAKRGDRVGRDRALARSKKMLRQAGQMASKSNAARRELTTLAHEVEFEVEMARRLREESEMLARTASDHVRRGADLHREWRRLGESGARLLDDAARKAERRQADAHEVARLREQAARDRAEADRLTEAAAGAAREAERQRGAAGKGARSARRLERKAEALVAAMAEARGLVDDRRARCVALEADAVGLLARAGSLKAEAARERSEADDLDRSAAEADAEGRTALADMAAFEVRTTLVVPPRARRRDSHRSDLTVAVPDAVDLPALTLLLEPPDADGARVLRLEGWGLERVAATAATPGCGLAFVVGGLPPGTRLSRGWRHPASGLWLVTAEEADGLALHGPLSDSLAEALQVSCFLWRDDGRSQWISTSAASLLGAGADDEVAPAGRFS